MRAAVPGPGERTPVGHESPCLGHPALAPAELVHGFFRRLDAGPARAMRLVAGEPLGDGRADIVRSWAQAESVRSRELRSPSENAVVAEVVTGYTDVSRWDLRYPLTVGRDIPLIDRAEVVSARRRVVR